jgi:hypothetical protein
MRAMERVQSGQGTEADVELAADYSTKQLVDAGQMTEEQAAKAKADMIKDYLAQQAVSKRIQASQKN